ncbi:Kinase associated protein B [Schinkia azotoformans MEV2011]|uniref:Kinase associated protein B n=1 Tax=Schinkia azotoformans MEV2011 TaxID=1348973 RepID=A0A072NRG4_SCHAZ|nr:kinase-associated lipoprotein B [Schinkia azotoformans]KEF40051.1 Kinase associated protein B [Schinkia azotoformans MEV2011]MEC1694747.1 kinase-associated lipoprotein B [Schinkia azotoformans]MEC1726430.1 kinase-associated lipoprotein B [Schinkia azotoformans]MEC1744758.1 kinase-associated lipoprotein B [Schinkia azotoformans]MEC1780392.1 kinase-associated lipoprotein B [Schinkia azotoformans]
MSEGYQIGQIVTGIYKTGKYIGEVTAIKPQHITIRVKAVLKHPLQGDLHAPRQSDVLFFHERRALALNEQTNIPKTQVKLYEDEMPEYYESLKNVVDDQITELKNTDSDWAKQSLKIFESLKKEYFK